MKIQLTSDASCGNVPHSKRRIHRCPHERKPHHQPRRRRKRYQTSGHQTPLSITVTHHHDLVLRRWWQTLEPCRDTANTASGSAQSNTTGKVVQKNDRIIVFVLRDGASEKLRLTDSLFVNNNVKRRIPHLNGSPFKLPSAFGSRKPTD